MAAKPYFFSRFDNPKSELKSAKRLLALEEDFFETYRDVGASNVAARSAARVKEYKQDITDLETRIEENAP